MELSIIIPCYNERERIRKTFEQIIFYLKRKNYKTELIFVDDGSTDKTLQVLNSLIKKTKQNSSIQAKIISYEANRGKGYAIKKGIIQASQKYLLICDADLSTPIDEVEKLRKFINKYDIVIGSRKQDDSHVIKAQSPLRELLGRSYSYLSKIVLGVNVNDFTCGFKLIKTNKAKIIAQKMTIDRWGCDSELLKISSLLKYKIKEIGVAWRNDERTKVKLVHDTFSSLFDLIKISINSKLNKYV